MNNLEQLDQKYLIVEMLNRPNFYDGQILYESLYEIDKSMNENVRIYRDNLKEFKDFLEIWVHEAKLPLATANLILHNQKGNNDTRLSLQLSRINDNIEQVLYYARSEHSEKDYLIKEANLSKTIASVLMRNKDLLLENKIEVIIETIDTIVMTDSKWLEFIINQIVNNSIKYSKNDDDSFLKISLKENRDSVTLIILDNGIGINDADISKVFEKSFTGHNGRSRQTSTGMGLYIAKNLCSKLGHHIAIKSQENKFTEVSITFYRNDFYNVAK